VLQLKHSHWGTYMPGQHLEPNNIFPAEECGGGCCSAPQWMLQLGALPPSASRAMQAGAAPQLCLLPRKSPLGAWQGLADGTAWASSGWRSSPPRSCTRKTPLRHAPPPLAGANQTESHRGAWGWADIRCALPAPFICEVPFPSPPPPSPSPPYLASVQYASYVSDMASAGQGSSYFWNPDDSSYPEAVAACADMGAALVAYTSLKEQMEVEAAFGAQELFLPRTRAYWMGLQVDPGLGTSWPQFTWPDGSGARRSSGRVCRGRLAARCALRAGRAGSWPAAACSPARPGRARRSRAAPAGRAASAGAPCPPPPWVAP
jgi:hypothetical protein